MYSQDEAEGSLGVCSSVLTHPVRKRGVGGIFESGELGFTKRVASMVMELSKSRFGWSKKGVSQ